jgi:high affinity choline transporter 7
MLGGVPWQVYFQRVLACRSANGAVGMSLAAAVGCLLLAVPPVVIGAVGATADWSAVGAVAPMNPALVLPHVLRDLTPPLIGVIGLGAVAAAVMSSVDSSILSASSMLVWNVYRPLVRPHASAEENRWVMRAAVGLIGGVATLLALRVGSVYALWYLCADLVYVVLFPQLVMALWWPKANVIGAAAGIGIGLLLRLGAGEPLLGLPSFLPYPMIGADGVSQLPFRTFAMLMTFVAIYAVSLLTQRLAAPRPLGKGIEGLGA